MSKMKKCKVGIIGCGGQATNHAKAYKMVQEVELTACADLIEDKALSFVEKFGFKRHYNSYEEMLEEEELDIADVVTKNYQHVEPTIAAAEAGVKAIFCEKPMATNLGDADRMLEACRKNGVKLTIDHTTRFEANWRKIKELIDKGEIGELRTIQQYHIGEVGSLLNNATHGTDALLFYGGDVEYLLANVERRPDRKDAKENATIYMQHKSGVESFYFFGGFRDYRYEAITFEGSKGKIEARLFRGWTPLMKIWRYDQHGLSPPNALREGEEIEAFDNVPLKMAMKEIIESIEQDKETICPGTTGRASLELVMAAYESERQGRKKIKLPLQISESPLDLMIKSGRMPHIPMTRYDEDELILGDEKWVFE